MEDAGYRVLDADSLPGYLRGLPDVVKILGSVGDLIIEEIGDGNLNYVYKVSSKDLPDNSIILKQAVPYLRMAGEGWPLSRDRMKFEIRALNLYSELSPGYVPKVYHSDEEMSVMVMQCLCNHKVLRYGMINGEVYPDLGRNIGSFLAETLFRTSVFGMGSQERRELMDQFTLNHELCKLTEDFVFTFPFMEHESNYSNPNTDEYARKKLRADAEYKAGVLKFKDLFLTKSDALLHADLHTGSLMVNQEETYVIDPEFAYFGPFGFDIGKIIANFLLSYTSHFYHSETPSYQEWLLSQVADIWSTFEKQFLALWEDQEKSAMFIPGLLGEDELAAYRQNTMLKILRDSIGFCACSLARRTLGIAGVADIRGIEDLEIRSILEVVNLELSRLLMSNCNELNSIENFISTVRRFYEVQSLDYMGPLK